MAVAGASIVDAKIITLTNGMALDTFWVQERRAAPSTPRPPGAARRGSRRRSSAASAPSGELKAVREPALPRRTRVFTVPPRVVIDNQASNTHTVIEVNGRDRPGLLHDVTAALTELGLQIATAHITTYGERAVDVFYVKDVFGLKVEDEAKLEQIEQRLLQAIAAPEEPPQPAQPAVEAAAE